MVFVLLTGITQDSNNYKEIPELVVLNYIRHQRTLVCNFAILALSRSKNVHRNFNVLDCDQCLRLIWQKLLLGILR